MAAGEPGLTNDQVVAPPHAQFYTLQRCLVAHTCSRQAGILVARASSCLHAHLDGCHIKHVAAACCMHMQGVAESAASPLLPMPLAPATVAACSAAHRCQQCGAVALALATSCGHHCQLAICGDSSFANAFPDHHVHSAMCPRLLPHSYLRQFWPVHVVSLKVLRSCACRHTGCPPSGERGGNGCRPGCCFRGSTQAVRPVHICAAPLVGKHKNLLTILRMLPLSTYHAKAYACRPMCCAGTTGWHIRRRPSVAARSRGADCW
jgi:hypothetical protein